MATATLDSQGTPTAASAAGKYLTFNLAGQSYGIDVLKIREIVRIADITSVPQMPPWVLGVINLRGKIIPVIDLRLRFGLQPSTDTAQCCTIVAQARLPDGKTTQLGMIVDGVEEVAQVAAGEIEEAPDFGRELCGSYIIGMAKIRGSVKTLLDVDRVLAGDLPPELASATS